MKGFNIGRVPPISFGAGRLADLPELVSGMANGPVFVVADTALSQLGVTDRLSANLTAAGIRSDVAADVAGEPKEALIDDLCARLRTLGARAVVGIGGGAAMDAAKLVAVIAHTGRPAADYALGGHDFPADGLPAIAVPTTAGTGSEVTRTSIVSTAGGNKNWYWGEELMFAHAILDPELTVSLPPHITAWTGIDAVAHALEASTSRKTSAAGLMFGHEALKILVDALPRAVADGEDIEARGRVLWGSTVAGLALHNCNTHMGHNISHALGSLARIHHGLATGLALEVTLPWLVRRPEGSHNYAMAAQVLGGAAEATELPDTFVALLRSCGIAARLPEACAEVSGRELAAAMKSDACHSISQNAACPVGPDDLDEMAEMMMALPMVEAA
ncbi:MAG: iron-containing alcohol dehydrogenase [Pseudomonadota bacterium]